MSYNHTSVGLTAAANDVVAQAVTIITMQTNFGTGNLVI